MKATCCERVVFSALIYNSHVAMCSSLIIGDYSVQFPDLKRSFVSLVIKAYSKFQCLFCFFIHR